MLLSKVTPWQLLYLYAGNVAKLASPNGAEASHLAAADAD